MMTKFQLWQNLAQSLAVDGHDTAQCRTVSLLVDKLYQFLFEEMTGWVPEWGTNPVSSSEEVSTKPLSHCISF